MLEQLTEDSWLSPFPQYQTTERPDRAAKEILNGKIVLLCDNSPVCADSSGQYLTALWKAVRTGTTGLRWRLSCGLCGMWPLAAATLLPGLVSGGDPFSYTDSALQI